MLKNHIRSCIVLISAGFILQPISFLNSASTINVKRYPAELQVTYELFTNKCSKCHDLDSTINSEYVMPTYYKEMVQEMYEKPDSGMSQQDADKIYEFLVYDAYKRRRRDVREQMRLLPEEQSEKEKEVFKEIRDKYKS